MRSRVQQKPLHSLAALMTEQQHDVGRQCLAERACELLELVSHSAHALSQRRMRVFEPAHRDQRLACHVVRQLVHHRRRALVQPVRLPVQASADFLQH